MLNRGLAAPRPKQRNQIESTRSIYKAVLLKKRAGGSFDLAPLRGTHSFRQILRGIVRPGFDLDEHDLIAIQSDEVDLAKPTPIVTSDDTQFLFFEKAGSGALTPPAQTKMQARRQRLRVRGPSDRPQAFYEREVHAVSWPSRPGYAGNTAWHGEPSRGVLRLHR